VSVEHRLERAFSSWHVKPAFGEPAYRYFARLVAEESLPSAQTYARSIGIETGSLLSEEISDKVYELPLSEDARTSLERWSPRKKGRFYDLAGQRVRVRHLSTTRRRFCRGCLADSPSHRIWWDIVSFRRCPVHGTEIEDKYGDDRPIYWAWPHYGQAPDGESLIARLPEIDGRGMYEDYLLQRLCCHAGPARPLLDRFDLFEVIDLCDFFGRFFSNPWTLAAPVSSFNHQAGFEALGGTRDELVARFEGWLDKNAADALKAGIEHGYGWIRRGGRGVNQHRKAWAVFDRAQKQAFANKARVSAFSTRGDVDFRFITLGMLSEELEVDIRRLKPFLSKEGLLSTDRKFSPDDVIEVKRFIVNLMSSAEAGAALGCNPKMIAHFVTNGDLIGYRGMKSLGRWKVTPQSVADFAARIRSLPTSNEPGKRVKLFKYARVTGLTDRKAVQMLLSGRLVPAAIDPSRKGFDAVRIKMGDVAQAVRSTAREEEMTFGRAKTLLGLRHESIPALADAGVLKIIRSRNSRRFLSKASVTAFSERYVEASKYRKELKAPNNKVAEALDRLGVERHFSEIEGVRDHIVERRSLFAALNMTEVSEEITNTWREFMAIASEVCPAYLLPQTLTRSEQAIYNSTRVTRFTVAIDDDRILLRKRFDRRASREWDWFEENRLKVYETLAFLNLRKKPGHDDVEGRSYLDSRHTMTSVASAIAEYHWLLLKKEIR
jgi:hypothetical protein